MIEVEVRTRDSNRVLHADTLGYVGKPLMMGCYCLLTGNTEPFPWEFPRDYVFMPVSDELPLLQQE